MPASLQDALASLNVVNVLKDQWRKTQQENLEYGGWICVKGTGTALEYTARAKKGTSYCSIILTAPSDLAALATSGFTILADFHCHPAIGLGSCKPSQGDVDGAEGLPYRRLVFTPDRLNDLQQYDGRCTPRPTPASFNIDDVVMWDITYKKVAANAGPVA